MTGVVGAPAKTSGVAPAGAFINPLSLTTARAGTVYRREAHTPVSSQQSRGVSPSLSPARRYNSNATPLTSAGIADITFIHVIPHQLLETKAGGIYITRPSADTHRTRADVRFNFAGMAVIFYFFVHPSAASRAPPISLVFSFGFPPAPPTGLSPFLLISRVTRSREVFDKAARSVPL